ncbi:MAG: ATP-binding protein [Polyangia bacterium]
MTRLFAKITVSLLLTLAVAVLLAGLILMEHMQKRWEQNAPPFVELVGIAVRDAAPEGAGSEDMEAAIERLSARHGLPMEIVSPAEVDWPRATRDALEAGGIAWCVDWKPSPGADIRYGASVFVPIEDGERVIAVGPHRPVLPGWEVWLLVGLAVFGVVSLVGLAVTYPVARWLGDLERAADRIERGDLEARSTVRSSGPIGSLAESFNRMADRIQRLLEDQRQLVQAVAHELRTPIARVRFGLEMMEIEADPEQIAERRRSLEGDLGELDSLVGELLLFSRYDSGRAVVHPERNDVEALARSSIERFAPLAPGLSFEIDSELGKDGEAVIDGKSFCRVLENLLANAARHAEELVVVRLARDGELLSVAVHDDGPGIPDEARRRVLEPFVRLDESRSRSSGGTGLGLAIVQRVLRANRGEIRVERSDLGGAAVITRWPLPADLRR